MTDPTKISQLGRNAWKRVIASAILQELGDDTHSARVLISSPSPSTVKDLGHARGKKHCVCCSGARADEAVIIISLSSHGQHRAAANFLVPTCVQFAVKGDRRSVLEDALATAHAFLGTNWRIRIRGCCRILDDGGESLPLPSGCPWSLLVKSGAASGNKIPQTV